GPPIVTFFGVAILRLLDCNPRQEADALSTKEQLPSDRRSFESSGRRTSATSKAHFNESSALPELIRHSEELSPVPRHDHFSILEEGIGLFREKSSRPARSVLVRAIGRLLRKPFVWLHYDVHVQEDGDGAVAGGHPRQSASPESAGETARDPCKLSLR